jgi:hypothetical protein
MSPGGAIIDQNYSPAYIRNDSMSQQAQTSRWWSIVTLDEEINNE